MTLLEEEGGPLDLLLRRPLHLSLQFLLGSPTSLHDAGHLASGDDGCLRVGRWSALTMPLSLSELHNACLRPPCGTSSIPRRVHVVMTRFPRPDCRSACRWCVLEPTWVYVLHRQSTVFLSEHYEVSPMHVYWLYASVPHPIYDRETLRAGG